MRKKFGYQARAAIFAAAMIVSGAGMYQTTAKAAEGQIRTPQQKTAVETQESAKLKGRSRIRRSDRGRRIHSDL